MTIWRILFTVLLISITLYAPWWCVLGGTVVGTFLFPRYYDVIMIVVLSDVLYGIAGGMSVGFGAQGLLAGVAVFVVMERIKRNLR